MPTWLHINFLPALLPSSGSFRQHSRSPLFLLHLACYAGYIAKGAGQRSAKWLTSLNKVIPEIVLIVAYVQMWHNNSMAIDPLAEHELFGSGGDHGRGGDVLGVVDVSHPLSRHPGVMFWAPRFPGRARVTSA